MNEEQKVDRKPTCPDCRACEHCGVIAHEGRGPMSQHKPGCPLRVKFLAEQEARKAKERAQ